MKNIAAYALLVLGGKGEPSQADIEKVLKEGGIKADSDATKKVVDCLKGKQFHELVKEGLGKLSSAGGSGGAPAGGAGGAAPGPKKEEPKEEPKEEEADVDMGGLFGDEY